MLGTLAFAFLLVQSADTVELSPSEALRRFLESSPRVEAADHLVRAGSARAVQARAWTNPMLSFSVENLGAAEAVTGLPAPDGLEGQALLGLVLPLGGGRGAGIRQADARVRASTADAEWVRGDAAVQAVGAAASAQRDRRLAVLAAEEAGTLRSLADARSAQAAEGRASEGEAARIRLAAALAEATLAEARGAEAVATAELARILGYGPGTVVRVAAGNCSTAGAPDGGSPPEVDAARAREEVARAGLDLARASRIPDLQPQVGFRRAAGTDALYVGLGFQVPLFDRRGGFVDAASAELAAAEADLRASMEAVEARRTAAARALEALDEAGAGFRTGWVDDLDRVVEATEARYELGEGTLVELLDGRRARFEALSSRERWRAAWQTQRALLLGLSGVGPTPDLFCDPLAPEN